VSESKQPNIEEWKNKDEGRPVIGCDGYSDGLEPVVSLDLAKCNTTSDMLKAMAQTSFSARALGEAADVLEAMVRDPKCFVIGTFSGAMTVAKMGLVLSDMIDHGMLDCVVSTGALMAHGFCADSGGVHFKHRPDMDDQELFWKGYDRVYDTLELEKNLDDTEVIVCAVLNKWPTDKPMSSEGFLHELGRWLHENTAEQARGILKSSFRKNIPVYVPAFTDSELGLDFGVFNHKLRVAGKQQIRFDRGTPSACSRPSESGSSPSAEASRATGPSRSGPTSTSLRSASARKKGCSSASSTPCESAPSPCTGAA
jgi:deoxyhypusine synthase